MKHILKHWHLLACWITCIFLARGIFSPGIPSAWDGGAHFVRLTIMAEQFLPSFTTNSWSFDWYNGFCPFQFYPNFYFIFWGSIYQLLGTKIPLLFIFKISMVIGYCLLPTGIYICARLFGMTLTQSALAAFCSIGITAIHGIGLAAVFVSGLIPNAYGLFLFCTTLGLLYGCLNGNRKLVPFCGLSMGILCLTHLISTIVFLLAAICLFVFFLCKKRMIQRLIDFSLVMLIGGGIGFSTFFDICFHQKLLGPGTGWGDIPFADFFNYNHMGGCIVNVSAILGLLWKLFKRERGEIYGYCLFMIALLYLLSVGLPTLHFNILDQFSHQILKSRSYAFLGLFLAFGAGIFWAEVITKAQTLIPRKGFYILIACIVTLLSIDHYYRLRSTLEWVKTDFDFDNLEHRTNQNAFQWLKMNIPTQINVGFDDRFIEFGNPGYNQMASRIVSESGHRCILGNQIEATQAHNGLFLSHLHDWSSRQIMSALRRYGVDYIISWTDDVQTHLKLFPHEVEEVYKNERVKIWKRKGPLSNRADDNKSLVLVEQLHNNLKWTVLKHANNVVLSANWHPYWTVINNDKSVPFLQTWDHMIAIPSLDKGVLSLHYEEPTWIRLLKLFSILFGITAAGFLFLKSRLTKNLPLFCQ